MPNAGRAPSVTAEVIGTGTLIDDGRRALVAGEALERLRNPGVRLWLRNGLGRTVRATVTERLEIEVFR